ncbi:MAG: methyl-accepting chemotaxis protein [Desulfuromonadaceae bacterium]|nr:methyl-accepting chemotaxis protein [Desulfuromonadaceae bacterium]
MQIKHYRDWSIHSKIMIIPVIGLMLIVAGTEFVLVPKISDWLMEQEMQKVRNVVEVAYQEFTEAANDVALGLSSIEDAQRHVRIAVNQMRYNDTEYLWINDMDKPFPKMIMHPTVPDLDYRVLDDAKFNKATSMRDGLDGAIRKLDNKNLFVAFNEVAERAGHGFVTYEWPKPTAAGGVTSELYTKLSYIKLFKPWGWVIGSGLYIDTFKAKVQNLHLVLLGAAAALSTSLMLLAWTIARNIKRSVDEEQDFAASVASGDLTKCLVINHHDELGDLGTSLNAMVADLRNMVLNIFANSRELSQATADIGHASHTMVVSAKRQQEDVQDITDSAIEISCLTCSVNAGVDSLSTSVGESASTVMELSASIEEVVRNMELLTTSVDDIGTSIHHLSGSIRQIDNGVHALDQTSATTASSVQEFDTSIRSIESYANESFIISNQVINDAESGKQAVEATIAGIRQIMNASQITAGSIGSLSNKAKNIGSIVTVIDEIAQQTNLLALNASIIAAQAGEHGRSFAVVASEIKRLAERTTRSTREIGEVIKGVQAEIAEAVKSISVATESINNGERLSHQAGSVLEKIVSGVNSTSQQMSKIASTTKEQSRGSEMIRKAMEQIADMTAAIAQNTEQQRKGSELIQSEVENVRLFSSDVMRSTQEQANVGELIGNMTQNVSNMCEQIRKTCAEQSLGSQRIGESVERIRQSSADVGKETQVVNNGVAKLGKQTELLLQEISSFKIK